MRSYTQRSFWQAYELLPGDVQRQARDAYRFFETNPNHPSLEFKRVGKRRPVYSVRITANYRALGLLERGDIVWFWIGPHHEYDRLLSRQ